MLPARALRSADDGKLADEMDDYVLVDGDPLANLKDVRKVQVVAQSGRVVFRK